MGRTAYTEPQFLYKGVLYLTSVPVRGCTYLTSVPVQGRALSFLLYPLPHYLSVCLSVCLSVSVRLSVPISCSEQLTSCHEICSDL